MALDKNLYKIAYELHRQWNEAEIAERINNREVLLSQDAFQRYASLVEFCWKLSSSPSEKQVRQKMVDLAHYYQNLQKFETWRFARGKAT